MDPVETNTTRYFIDENGIFYSVVRPGAVIDLEEAKANEKARAPFLASGRFPVLMDIRNIRHITLKAMRFTKEQGVPDSFTRAALLVGPLQSQVIASLTRRFGKFHIPVGTFKSEDEAVAWLLQND